MLRVLAARMAGARSTIFQILGPAGSRFLPAACIWTIDSARPARRLVMDQDQLSGVKV
jgi:hypothetical protein